MKIRHSIMCTCASVIVAASIFTGCSTEAVPGPGVAETDSITSLPFFNKPDWTPEWIPDTAAAYPGIHRIPDFSFTDQSGSLITRQTIQGKICVVNFFFTRCSMICPKMTANMGILQDAFRNDTTICLLSHSVTPELDSVAVLQRYAKLHHIDQRNWHLLTGDHDSIYRMARKEYFAGDSVGYFKSSDEFLHTENVILLDRQQRIRGVYNGTLPVEMDRIIADIRLLQKE